MKAIQFTPWTTQPKLDTDAARHATN